MITSLHDLWHLHHLQQLNNYCATRTGNASHCRCRARSGINYGYGGDTRHMRCRLTINNLSDDENMGSGMELISHKSHQRPFHTQTDNEEAPNTPNRQQSLGSAIFSGNSWMPPTRLTRSMARHATVTTSAPSHGVVQQCQHGDNHAESLVPAKTALRFAQNGLPYRMVGKTRIITTLLIRENHEGHNV